MQRKITEAMAPEEDLPDLTPQQRKFVEGILANKSASEAYRCAYDAENMKDTSIWTEASRVRNNASVSLWISAARKAGLWQPKVSLDQHLSRLDRLEELCIVSGNMGAAVQAEQLIGKASGHYTENLNIMASDPLDMLKEIASLSPALAAQLAKDNGIEWETQH